jgi:hypothetical protein
MAGGELAEILEEQDELEHSLREGYGSDPYPGSVPPPLGEVIDKHMPKTPLDDLKRDIEGA